jgi:hypothetical protein
VQGGQQSDSHMLPPLGHLFGPDGHCQEVLLYFESQIILARKPKKKNTKQRNFFQKKKEVR